MSPDAVIETIVALLLLIGTTLALLSAIGILRLPDIYTRSHAGTKSATLGVLCTLLGTFIFFAGIENFFSVRLILGILFVFLTAPVAGHLMCRAAYRSGVPMSDRSVSDELKEVLSVKKEE
ncbi:multisubunit sodium/proton antiporter MrpG subunit [Sinobaca qinghaiensis]|uniref:Multisubunit sodium/proton antiporter MrpG subunit n=1 Tax=Sinobaca qinghaiensis TaxID=342944 RepID=A0A419V4M3_9BACL|nr:Na+/H+ antiporter subunit G [Sinobaca qinghaiensis]RKD73450.1 multisubunit sodium/proton antiporter MrpG subunit [Sinobaca qinghaiensis]